MSATVAQPPARPAVACPRCGAEVPPERDWCLECGEAARTEILPARGWRLPIAIVVGVVLLAGIAAIVAFAQLSSDAGDAARLAQAPPTAPTTPSTTTLPSGGTTTTTTTPTIPTTPSTPAPSGALATWPSGRTAYTVVLISSTSPAAARAAAQKLLGQGRGKPVGTLRSDDYPSLTPGYVVVFSGQYATLAAAQRAAQGWHGTGSPGAYAKFVSPRAGGARSGAPPPVAPTGAAPTPSGGGAAPTP